MLLPADVFHVFVRFMEHLEFKDACRVREVSPAWYQFSRSVGERNVTDCKHCTGHVTNRLGTRCAGITYGRTPRYDR